MSIFQALADLEKSGQSGALCTIISSQGSTPRHQGSKMLVYPDGRITGSVGGGELENRVIRAALASIQSGKSALMEFSMVDPKEGDPGICGGTLNVYIEPFGGKPEVLIVGGGHVGKAVAHLAKWLGFWVIVSDDRAEFCTLDANPDADEFLPVAFHELADVRKITRNTAVVVTTRGSMVDIPGLPGILKSDAGYIGVIGSKRRWLTTQNGLVSAGIPEDDIRRIHSPIGIELKAETPEEIAVSIMAEILMLRNGASGERMTL